MSTRTTRGNIFRDLGTSEEVAENLVIRAQLMQELQKTIRQRGLTQREAAEILAVEQSRISNLMTGRISLFSIDALVNMGVRLGLEIRFVVASTAALQGSRQQLNKTNDADTQSPARPRTDPSVQKPSHRPGTGGIGSHQ